MHVSAAVISNIILVLSVCVCKKLEQQLYEVTTEHRNTMDIHLIELVPSLYTAVIPVYSMWLNRTLQTIGSVSFNL